MPVMPALRVEIRPRCKLYSHLASVESVLGHDPRETASAAGRADGDGDGDGAADALRADGAGEAEDVRQQEETWALEQRIVRIILDRLDFSGSQLRSKWKKNFLFLFFSFFSFFLFLLLFFWKRRRKRKKGNGKK